jgi:hypothetical protein
MASVSAKVETEILEAEDEEGTTEAVSCAFVDLEQ